jgi:tetratricopeptide (TPR) repeat protein
MNRYYDVVSLEHQAQLARATQLYDDAIVFHSHAVMIADQLQEPRLVAVLCDRLGSTLMASGDIADATTAYRAGVQSFSATPDLNIEQTLVTLRAVGDCSFAAAPIADQYDKEVAETLNSALQDPTLPARLLVSCADGYAHQGCYDQALHAYRQALVLVEAVDAPELHAHVLAQLGIMAFRCGETATVDEMLHELLALQLSITDPQAQCCILTAQGNIYEVRGESQRALAIYRHVTQLSLATNDPVTRGSARGQLMRLSIQQRRRVKQQRRTEQDVPADEQDTVPAFQQPVAPEVLRMRTYELA